jgi:hypothetical protein
MQTKKLVVVSFLILIIMPMVFAYQSTITVNTGLPDKEIVFKPANPDTGKSIASITETSDNSGVVVFNYDLDEMRIKMGFQAFNSAGTNINFLNGKPSIFFSNVILDKFIDIDLNKDEPSIKIYSGEEVEGSEGDLDVVVEIEEELAEIEEENESEVVEEIIGETEVVEEIIEETEIIEQESSLGITGKAISESKSVLTSAKTYYILGGIIILIIVIIFFRKKMNKKGNFKVTKMSEIQENKDKIENNDEKLDDAEKKLKEAKEELDEIRDKKNKLKEAQEKFARDKEELRRLEG